MERLQLTMIPAPNERRLAFVGDTIRFELKLDSPLPGRKYTARLRTNLGRAAARRSEIIAARGANGVATNSSWRDIPMHPSSTGWQIDIPLAEVGFFKAKAYLLDEKNWQHWPDGEDMGISVHPNFARTANTIYCAFTRLFGPSKSLANTAEPTLENQLQALEAKGYATLPPSGKFRDLTKQLPFIVHKLGCRIIHLLPVNPTPTTYARFGRFGSPYAALDLTAVDPALVEFDQHTTGIEQFCELTEAAHTLGARVFIDIVINHTGWGSTLQENHPEFFLKKPDGQFASPGAWGVTWEDLVELEQHDAALWDLIADSLITWCRRGVDGFRCDAGYKIPTPAWQYIIARVQEEFPEAIFLLEGLGGSWDATESLLTDGGMQWAYSELFQNYSGSEVAWYQDYINGQNQRVGCYINYSETHDNDRLAKRGRRWSLLRNQLCALTSPCGGFAFTCGVEWLATEKIRVHGNTGLNWNAEENLVLELSRLNELLCSHPCFFDGARLLRLSLPTAPVLVLLRVAKSGQDAVLVIANTDPEQAQNAEIPTASTEYLPPTFTHELLCQTPPSWEPSPAGWRLALPPGAVYCLAPTRLPAGPAGDEYRQQCARAAFAVNALQQLRPTEQVQDRTPAQLAAAADRDPAQYLAALSEFADQDGRVPLSQLLEATAAGAIFPRVISWTLVDSRRTTVIPPGHWLLITDAAPFHATLTQSPGTAQEHRRQSQSIPAGGRHVACFAPMQEAAEAVLRVARHAATSRQISAAIRYLPARPENQVPRPAPTDLVLLTNQRGGMARLCVDLGRITSKYDCILGANLHPTVPVDRHVLVKRLRAWVNADGFLSELNYQNLKTFTRYPQPAWDFVVNAGDGRTVEIQLTAEMLDARNTVIFRFVRPTEKSAHGKQLPASADVRIILRPDIEDRNFHAETKRNDGADHHFATHTRTLQPEIGFTFHPAPDRTLQVWADAGAYHPQPEWSQNIPHPVEQSRGQEACGDAYSPGWFELPLAKGNTRTFTLSAENEPATGVQPATHRQPAAPADFTHWLTLAARQFVVKRDDFKTVIAGYPWFLDWGRDSLICARGLLAAGWREEVEKILVTFARFEQSGTLPNTIHGHDVSNRDTSDAPLWFATVCADLADQHFFDRVVDGRRTIREVITSIARGYLHGTPNGIHVDPASGLVWSPSHFTWMDTNYPAGTPREGYPVEIQALWIRLLRLLEKIAPGKERAEWGALADRAQTSFQKYFWLEDQGWLADVLLARPGMAAANAVVSDALRSNCLLAISLGLVTGQPARRCVEAARKYLVVPGGLRTLAPLPVTTPLPVVGNQKQIINDPQNPYWPRYEGDEDTRRKPAYHNGTAWTWTFPTFCEALAVAWEHAGPAMAAARSYLLSTEKLLHTGCLGQLPEIMDGDHPHAQRGCDAQAWSITETLRVWKLLADE